MKLTITSCGTLYTFAFNFIISITYPSMSKDISQVSLTLKSFVNSNQSSYSMRCNIFSFHKTACVLRIIYYWKYVFSGTYFFKWFRENHRFVEFHNWNWFGKIAIIWSLLHIFLVSITHSYCALYFFELFVMFSMHLPPEFVAKKCI